MNRRTFVTAAFRLGSLGALPWLLGDLPALAVRASAAIAAQSPGDPGPHPLVALVERFQSLYDANKTATIGRELLARDVIWHAGGDQAHDQRGPAAVLSGYAHVCRSRPPSPSHILPASDDLVMEIRRHPPSGPGLRPRLWILAYTVKRGRIAAVRHFDLEAPTADGFFQRLPG